MNSKNPNDWLKDLTEDELIKSIQSEHSKRLSPSVKDLLLIGIESLRQGNNNWANDLGARIKKRQSNKQRSIDANKIRHQKTNKFYEEAYQLFIKTPGRSKRSRVEEIIPELNEFTKRECDSFWPKGADPIYKKMLKMNKERKK